MTTRLTRDSLTIIQSRREEGSRKPERSREKFQCRMYIEMTRRNSEQRCSRFVLSRADTRQRSKTRTEAEVNAACVQVCFLRFWINGNGKSSCHASTLPMENKNGRRRDQRNASSISFLFSTLLFDYPFRRFPISFYNYFSLASLLTRRFSNFSSFEHAVTVTVTLKRIYCKNFDPQTLWILRIIFRRERESIPLCDIANTKILFCSAPFLLQLFLLFFFMHNNNPCSLFESFVIAVKKIGKEKKKKNKKTLHTVRYNKSIFFSKFQYRLHVYYFFSLLISRFLNQNEKFSRKHNDKIDIIDSWKTSVTWAWLNKKRKKKKITKLYSYLKNIQSDYNKKISHLVHTRTAYTWNAHATLLRHFLS